MTQKSSGKPASGGVLPITGAATKKDPPHTASPKTNNSAAGPRLKLLVRRLPPGLTQNEFETAVGAEWMVGDSKVDFFLYKDGRVSKDPSKPSRPSRAYFRVTDVSLIQDLADKIQRTTFHDARNTFTDPVLLHPPTLEYAPFSRIPSGKVRKDGRRGTIDQDPEFIAFLESLTNPAPKPPPVDDSAEPEKKEEKPTITPLIQYLRDKKANKGKDSSAQKSAKQARLAAKEQKPERGQQQTKKKVLSRSERAAAASSGEKQGKADKATKDAVKAANKQILTQGSGSPGKKSAASAPAKDATASSSPPPPHPSAPAAAAERKRERGSISAATKILRRDLGLGPSSPGAKRSEENKPDTKPDADKASTTSTNRAKASAPKESKQDTASQKPTSTKNNKKEAPTEPAALRNKGSTPKTENASGKQAAAKSNAPSGGTGKTELSQPTATQAFLKHANPSQGVTEELLDSGFSQFGGVVKVEIDRKKGFGYVDFAEPEGLRKAIQASPVQIAQSQVVVLERRTGPAVNQTRGNQQQQPAPSPAQTNQAAAAPAKTTTPPQGPRGGRGGRGPRAKGGFGGRGRGGRGGGGSQGQGQGGPGSTAPGEGS